MKQFNRKSGGRSIGKRKTQSAGRTLMKLSYLTCVVAAGSYAQAGFADSLIKCEVEGDNYSFDIASFGSDLIESNHTVGHLYSAKKIARGYEIATTTGSVFRIEKTNEGKVQVFDRYVSGGVCAAAQVNETALNSLVRQDARLRSSYLVAECATRPGGARTVQITAQKGFAEGTVRLYAQDKDEDAQNGDLVFVAWALDFSQNEIAGRKQSAVELAGEGANRFAALGPKETPTSDLSVRFDSESRIGSFDANVETLPGFVDCQFSNIDFLKNSIR